MVWIIYFPYVVDKNLAKIFIYTSTLFDPGTNFAISGWIRRYYQERPFDAIGEITMEENVMARLVAIYSANNKPIALAEVQVFGKLYLNILF